MKTFRRVLAAFMVASLFVTGAALAQAPIPYVTGPLNPADVVGNTNRLIQQIDAQLNTQSGVEPISGPRNLIVGGDFGTNLWQRGTAASANITSTCTYWADAWCAYGGASSSINVTKETGSTDVPVGSLATYRLQRTAANTNTAQICAANIIDPQDVTPTVLNTTALQVTMKAGANFSGTSVTALVTTGAGNLANTTAANLVAGSWTTQANTGSFTLPVTSANTTFATYGAGSTLLGTVIPSGTTQIAVQLCFTPVGTAGTNDWIEFTLVQFETLPPLQQAASPFEHRQQQVETALEERRAYVINEGTITAGAVMSPVGTAQGTTTTCTTMIPFPVTMRAAPTYTNALTASTFKIVSASQTATALGTPFSATLGANTPYNASINFTTTGMTAKDSCFLVSAAGSGQMLFTADF